MSALKPYSQIIAELSPDDRRKYYERPTPLDRRIWRGETSWDAVLGRHVAVR